MRGPSAIAVAIAAARNGDTVAGVHSFLITSKGEMFLFEVVVISASLRGMTMIRRSDPKKRKSFGRLESCGVCLVR